MAPAKKGPDAKPQKSASEKEKADKAKQDLMKAFDAFDLNKDGVVSEQELIRILMRPTEEGTQMDKATATAMVNSFESFDVRVKLANVAPSLIVFIHALQTS